MQTRCPACGTAFRITAEQLKVRQGQVRCGRCQQIFNALEALIDRPAAAAEPSPVPEPQPVAPPASSATTQEAVATNEAAAAPTTEMTTAAESLVAPATAPTGPADAAQEGGGERVEDAAPGRDDDQPVGLAVVAEDDAAAPAAVEDFDLGDLDLDLALQQITQADDSGRADAASEQAQAADGAAALQASTGTLVAAVAADATQAEAAGMLDASPESPLAAPAKAVTRAAHAALNIDAALPYVASTTEAAMPQNLPFEVYEKTRRKTSRGWLWSALGMLLTLILLAQIALHFRVELGVLVPELRLGFRQVCETLGCQLPLPHKPDLLSIVSSDLHPQAGQPGQLRLLATLKNRAPFAQEYPHLELTLTDTVDQPLLRKVIAPGEYLEASTDLQQGFAAGSDLALQLALTIDTRTHAAAGYRLYVFYP